MKKGRRKKEYYREIHENLKKQTKLEQNFLEHQVSYYQELLEMKETEEPLKIFRRTYRNWLLERNDVEQKLLFSLIDLKKFQEKKKKEE